MLSGFCGTLMTPMAANFNIVPAALLELPDEYAVIKAQIPTALLLLVANTAIMYLFVYRTMTTRRSRTLASKFASLALAHVTREYPNKLDHVLNGPEDVRSPRELHPIFYGSFDWHSSVHGYWLLATLYRARARAARARARFARCSTSSSPPTNVAGEVAYLAQPIARRRSSGRTGGRGC